MKFDHKHKNAGGVIARALITLTGVVLRCHLCALIVSHTHSDNRDVVGTSRLETVQLEPGVRSQMRPIKTEHSEVVLSMLHLLWRGPSEVDGLHCLRFHTDRARRSGNWREGNIICCYMLLYVYLRIVCVCKTNLDQNPCIAYAMCTSFEPRCICNSRVALQTSELLLSWPSMCVSTTTQYSTPGFRLRNSVEKVFLLRFLASSRCLSLYRRTL